MLERLYRFVLALLPREFRDRFGAEMIETARSLDAEPRGRPWRRVKAVADAVSIPLSVRTDLRDDARHRLHAPRRTIMDALRQDLSVTLRGLRREPGFTSFCLITLALGIGANAAMFGIADRLLLSGPAGVRDAAQVVRVYATTQPAGMRPFTSDGFGYATYDRLRLGAKSFAAVATYAISETVVGTGRDARSAQVGYATASLFPLLGVQPERGRFFGELDDTPAAPRRVVVLSDGAWRAWLGGTDDAIGRTVALSDEPYLVIGVTPRGFSGPQFDRVDAWVPGSLLGRQITSDWTTAWNAQWLRIVGRLAPGVTVDAAGQEATNIRRLAYTGDDPADRAARFSVASLRANDAGTESIDLRVLRWLTGVSALVLLIACANIANLLLARGIRRGREVAIRAALGAGRLRLIRLLMIESVAIAIGGAALGLLVAWAVGHAARRVLFASIEWSGPVVNLRLIAASATIAIVTGILIGIVPAVRFSRPDVGDALKTGVREGGGRRSRLQSGLTMAQAALSVVLLIGAGLFVRSLWTAYTLDYGFNPDRVTIFDVSRRSLAQFPIGPARDTERSRRRAFLSGVLERVRALPDVEQASVAVGLPFGNRFSVMTRASGVPKMPTLSGGGPSISAVSNGYFETMETPIIRGRAFTPRDHAGTEPVTIVSQLMADTIWPGLDPIGRCLYVDVAPAPAPPPACSRVVGVAHDTYLSRLREDPVMHYYIPAGQEVSFGGAVLLVRARGPQPVPVSDVRRILTEGDGTITFISADTLRARIDPQLRPWKLGATVFAIAGVLALVVAGIGIYSVVSYLMAGRRREIGVRLALGARPADIARLVFAGSLPMAAAGVVAGEVVAWTLGGLAAPLLFETSPHDPLVYGLVAALLVGAATLATVGPARRARRVNAVEALRTE